MNIVGSVGKCLVCEQVFTYKNHWQKMCSKRCANMASRRRCKPRTKERTAQCIRIDGSDAFILLKGGIEVAIDAADLPLIESRRWRWMPDKRTGNGYAVTGYSTATGGQILMHRLLLDTPRGVVVDHKDGNGLNNRRSNIRNCTSGQNSANRFAARLGLVGSTLNKATGKYKSQIEHCGKAIFLGYFATEAEAKAAYQGASRALKGDFNPWRVNEEYQEHPGSGNSEEESN